jgi:hypothetical protein
LHHSQQEKVEHAGYSTDPEACFRLMLWRRSFCFAAQLGEAAVQYVRILRRLSVFLPLAQEHGVHDPTTFADVVFLLQETANRTGDLL